MRTTAPIEQLAARHGHYARELHRQFFRRLSLADCADVVQDALIAATMDETARSLDETELDHWLRRVARRRAINALHAPDRLGQGAVPRSHEDLHAFSELLADERQQLELEHDEDAEAFRAAFERLPAQEQRVLGLRHLDNLPVGTCAELVGLSRPKYERAHTEAVRRLVNLVVGIRPHDTCAEARSLINLSGGQELLDADNAARRDAHLAGCLHCRQYQRRSNGLLGLMPLPAVPFGDRLAARLHDLLARFLPAAPATEAAGGALGAGGVKVAALLATGVAAAGGTAAVVTAPQPHEAATHMTSVARTAAPAVTTTSTTPSRMVRASSWSTGAPTRSKARAAAQRATARRAASRARAAQAELKPSGTESPPVGSTSAHAASLAAGTAAANPTTTSNAHRSAAHAAPTGPAPDSSAGEFAPQP
jgi:RNA polymerase sigma factor (sigma-70 family)